MDEARIEVFKERCIGAGNCADVDPEHFDQDPADATVVVLHESVAPSAIANVERAVDACPVAALLVHRT